MKASKYYVPSTNLVSTILNIGMDTCDYKPAEECLEYSLIWKYEDKIQFQEFIDIAYNWINSKGYTVTMSMFPESLPTNIIVSFDNKIDFFSTIKFENSANVSFLNFKVQIILYVCQLIEYLEHM